jgi:hypothetical protein
VSKFTTVLVKLMLLTALIAPPWTVSQSSETYEQVGVITRLGYTFIKVDDKKYEISSGVKIQIGDNTRARLKDLKKGDTIWFKGRNISGVDYIDFINFLPTPSVI